MAVKPSAAEIKRWSARLGFPTRLAVPLLLSLGLLASVASASGRAEPLTIKRDVPYEIVGADRLLLDAYLPSGGGLHPAVLFVHGGGWRSGGKSAFAPGEQAFAPTATRLARLGYAVFSINYRLAPAFRFPAQVDDVRAAVVWVRANAKSYGVDAKRLALFGVSAGGNLAALVAMQGRGDLTVGARVKAVAVWSSPMELGSFDTAGRSQTEEYLGCSPTRCADRYRQASPMRYVDRTDPAMFIANGSRETIPLNQAELMAQRLGTDRVTHQLLVVPGTRHGAQYEDVALAPTLVFLGAQLALSHRP